MCNCKHVNTHGLLYLELTRKLLLLPSTNSINFKESSVRKNEFYGHGTDFVIFTNTETNKHDNYWQYIKLKIIIAFQTMVSQRKNKLRYATAE